MNNGDYLGIILDDGDIYWTSIDSIVALTVNFKSGDYLPSQSSKGSIVYSYTDKLDNPLNVYDGVRTDDFNRDVPLQYLTYQEYFNLPNKYDPGSLPVSFNYDRQLDYTLIRIWTTPDTSNNLLIKLTISQETSNLDTNRDQPQFPDQWYLAIVYNLAVLMAPRYDKHKDQGFTNLLSLAKDAENKAAEFDNEIGSVYIKPNFRY